MRKSTRHRLDAVPQEIKRLRAKDQRGKLRKRRQWLRELILSDTESVVGYFDTAEGMMIKFCVRYLCDIAGQQIEIIKIDASLYEAPHIHINHHGRRSTKIVWQNFTKYATARSAAIKFIRDNRINFKNQYLLEYANCKQKK